MNFLIGICKLWHLGHLQLFSWLNLFCFQYRGLMSAIACTKRPSYCMSFAFGASKPSNEE